MNRRTFVTTSAWLATVAGGAWPSVAGAALRSSTLAIVDRSLSGGPAFARYATHMRLPVFETGDDIGALWYTTLAPRLTPMSSLIGLARASDYFVLRELAIRAGLRADNISGQNTPSVTQHAHTAFTFTPRVLHHHET
jgi:hypothetical protein